jgi:lipoprotein NlpD
MLTKNRTKITGLLPFILVLGLSGCVDHGHYAPVVNRGHIHTITSTQYRVQPGDTLYSIAWASNLDFRQLAAMNRLKAPFALHPGDVLKVKLPSSKMAGFDHPSQATQALNKKSTSSKVGSNQKNLKENLLKLEPPNTLSTANLIKPISGSQYSNAKLAPQQRLAEKKLPLKSTSNEALVNHQSRDGSQVSKPGAARISTLSANEIKSQKQDQIYESEDADNEKGQLGQRKDLIFAKKSVHSWMWPVRGRVVGQFSSGQLGNKGIDIVGQYGQPVRASESGIVVYSGSGLRGYGNLIIIKHNASFLSAYAYNSELKVAEGEQVKAGQEIASMGRAMSGQVMLHFEIRRDGKPVNPLQYLR